MKPGPKGPWKYTETYLDHEADLLLAYAERSKLPTLEEFTESRDYWPEVIQNEKFVDRSAKFRLAHKRFKSIQLRKWLCSAANGDINATVFIFFAKNVLGWRDEKHIRATVDNLISFGMDRKLIPQDNRLSEFMESIESDVQE